MGPAKDKHGVRGSFAKVKFLFAKNGRSRIKEFWANPIYRYNINAIIANLICTCIYSWFVFMFLLEVEITRSEVAAQTIQFAESFSWTMTKWKNSSVCGSGVEPEKLWPSCNPLGAHQNDGWDENMSQFRWLPNPSLPPKNNTQQKHWYTTGLVLDLFIMKSSDDNEWQGGDVISSGLAPRK